MDLFDWIVVSLVLVAIFIAIGEGWLDSFFELPNIQIIGWACGVVAVGIAGYNFLTDTGSWKSWHIAMTTGAVALLIFLSETDSLEKLFTKAKKHWLGVMMTGSILVIIFHYMHRSWSQGILNYAIGVAAAAGVGMYFLPKCEKEGEKLLATFGLIGFGLFSIFLLPAILMRQPVGGEFVKLAEVTVYCVLGWAFFNWLAKRKKS